jgi:hypothetical protein
MKNIHILPTDKPSRLYLGNNGNFVFGMMQTSIQSRNDDFTNQNIYITSDEEIKEGDWHFKKTNNTVGNYILDSINPNKGRYNKIILTTDQDLIKDGVQAIDDEFLQWFVKNPSCGRVEVYYQLHKDEPLYKIIIPQEESKDFLGRSEFDLLKQEAIDEEMDEFDKQETLEEAAFNYSKYKVNKNKSLLDFTKGAKWQAERMYSEEEVNEIISEVWNSCEDNEGETFTEVRKRILNQFKKK